MMELFKMACVRKTISVSPDGTMYCDFVNSFTGLSMGYLSPCSSLQTSVPWDLQKTGLCDGPTPTPTDPPLDQQRKCIDSQTIGVWNTVKKAFDIAKCQTGSCVDGYCGPTNPNTQQDPVFLDPVFLPTPTTTTPTCPKGERYDKPWLGFGGCDDGYVSSDGAILQGAGSQCICSSSPYVPGLPGDSAESPGRDILGMMDKLIGSLPVIIMGFLGISILGMFKK